MHTAHSACGSVLERPVQEDVTLVELEVGAAKMAPTMSMVAVLGASAPIRQADATQKAAIVAVPYDNAVSRFLSPLQPLVLGLRTGRASAAAAGNFFLSVFSHLLS